MPSTGSPESVRDIIVAGYGFAGGAAAIAAADAGADVLLLEKMPDPGGISITAGGGIRTTSDRQAAFDYVRASNAGRTPDASIAPIADGMVWVADWLQALADECGARLSTTPSPGTYPLAGHDRLTMLEVAEIPGFDPAAAYPHARALGGGTRADRGGAAASSTGGGAGVFHILDRAIRRRADRIEVRLASPVIDLVDRDRAVIGVRARIDGEERRILARRGVVLACGGFESAPQMHQRYWQVEPVLSAACRGNTGDGIRMAQRLGADLWHMWHIHGSYGFRHPVHPEIGIRMKRLPDWRPAGPDTPSDSETRAAPMAWILVDRDGRRFMNEYPPYVQDTGHRPLEPYDPATLRFPRVPCWCVFDDAARRLYPMGSPVLNDRVASRHYDWSADNLKETGNGLLHAASSLAELAGRMAICPETLEQTVAGWNSAVARGADPLGRPAVSMVPVSTPPFYCGQIWPVVSNTQGGPRHDPRQRVLDPFDQVIPGLYVAGELGSIWGALYTSGCNLAECFITGRIAAEHAASRSGG